MKNAGYNSNVAKETTMINQTNPTLPLAIQHYGCNFMCHLYVARQHWSSQEVIDLYNQAIKAGAMSRNCYVKDPQLLLHLAGTQLRQVGGRSHGKNPTSWGLHSSDKRVQYVVLKWSQLGNSYHHFTVQDTKGHELYDPYHPDQASYRLEKGKQLSEQYYG
jgi:Protein of unknown function, DUF261